MVPTEGLTMSPWKLHLFTTELSVTEDEGEPYRLVQGNYQYGFDCSQKEYHTVSAQTHFLHTVTYFHYVVLTDVYF